MRKLLFILVLSTSIFADVPTPSPKDQQQAWQDSVNAANSMNNQGVGNVGFNNFSDINSGLNSLSNQVGSSTIDASKQSIDGNGQANSSVKNQYSSASNDQNYLYTQGKAGITQCKSQNDPACNAVTRYNDDAVQASFNQYNMGTNGYANNMYVTPDPNNATCSVLHSYAPINNQVIQCIAGRNTHNKCSTIISISIATHDCDPTTGSCDIYKTDSMCQKTREYSPASCNRYSYYTNYGGCQVGQNSCNVPSNFRTPGCNGSGGRDYVCGTCSTGGDTGDHNGCWGQQCTGWTPVQLASYACKVYSLNDQCLPFK